MSIRPNIALIHYLILRLNLLVIWQLSRVVHIHSPLILKVIASLSIGALILISSLLESSTIVLHKNLLLAQLRDLVAIYLSAQCVHTINLNVVEFGLYLLTFI